MPWRVSWLDEQETILLVRLIGRWSWDDFEAAGASCLALIGGKNHTVYLICDLTEGRDPPDNKVFAPVMRVFAKRHPNTGVRIIVGATAFVQIAISVITKVMGDALKFRYADTVDEAVAWITKMPIRNGN